jgi:formate hydrogenlyase transcriptional activator
VNSKNKTGRAVNHSLGKRLEFEMLLSGLSARLVALPMDRVDGEIHKALMDICAFFRLQSVSLVRHLPGGKSWIITDTSYPLGAAPFPVAKPRSASLLPYMSRKLENEHAVISFNSLEELPAEAAIDRQSLEKVGFQSALYLPIAAAASSGYYTLAIGSPQVGPACPEEYVPRLRLLGELFVNAIERRRMEIELRDRLGQIERLQLQLEKENIYLREAIKAVQGFEKIVGKSEPLQYVLFKVKQVAPTDAAVLLLGETGTGKGMIAHAVHELSARKDRPMITVNCAALPANLIESELFGREKGAFTGAHATQSGRFEIAHGGTIFLDEIGEMPTELQVKLLRVLEKGEFERLGSSRTIKVDVRVIAATNRDLKTEVSKGRFREDLFYRLNVFPVSIPPLRMRTDDIPELVSYFVDRYAQKFGKTYETLPKNAMKALQKYPWPGNVRELEHVVERAVITSPGPVLQLLDGLENEAAERVEVPLQGLEAVERDHICKTLEKTCWKIEGHGGAASILGLHPSTLRSRMKKLGVTIKKLGVTFP